MEKTMQYTHRFIHTRLSCGKNILELTTYGNISVWWCADTLFRNTMRSIIHNQRSKNLLNGKYFIRIYAWCGIYCECIYDLIMTVFIWLIEYVYRKKSNDIRQEKMTMVFSAQDLTWKTIQDNETRQPRKTDAFFNSILNSMGDWNLIGVYPITIHPIRGLNTYLEKLESWNVTHFPLNRFWSFGAYKEQKAAMKYFRKQFKYIVNDNSFRELCIEDGKDLYKEIKNLLEFYFTFLFPYQIKLITMTKKMIEYIRPDAIVLLNEYGWAERPMLIAAKLENIPVIAIQHGIITESHAGYIYKLGDISERGDALSPYCPVPDKTAVYGRYYNDLLTNYSSYPKKSIAITGQPRYDIIYIANELYSKCEFLKRYEIPEGRKMVLWTTQCHSLSLDENIKNFNAVFSAMKEVKNAILIIKQHQGEGETHNKLIRNYLEKYNLYAVVTPKNSDAIEQIDACDLMITKDSTTAIEAVALNKPVIVLNLSGYGDVTEYVKEGIAIGIYNGNDLKEAIQNLLLDDSILAKNRQEFAEKYLYKIDGKSSERVANLIKEVVLRIS